MKTLFRNFFKRIVDKQVSISEEENCQNTENEINITQDEGT